MADTRWAVFLLVAICPVFSTLNNVPVLLWQSQSLGTDLPSVSAVHQMSRNEFEEDILNKLDSKSPILCFIQDDLSLEDFTLWGNVYGRNDQKNSFSNIQSLLDTNPSTMLPSVESPEDSISTLANGRNMIEVEGAEFIPKGSLSNDLLIVHLPSTDATSDRQQALSKNDKIIGDTIKQVAESSPSYTAIYTGHSSSWVSAEGEHTRASRHALAVDAESTFNHSGLFYHTNESCLVYFENMTVDYYYKGDNDLDFNLTSTQLSNDWSFYDFDCKGDNASMTVHIEYDIKDASMQVSRAVVDLVLEAISYEDWILTNVSLDYTTAFGSGLEYIPADNQIWAPINASYHCAPQIFVNTTKDTTKYGLRFYNFQVQPFKNGGVFGTSFDCVGFFSIGIWMGIFVVGILIIILGFGIHMTLSINTMDRFDDPKGKTITVNALD